VGIKTKFDGEVIMSCNNLCFHSEQTCAYCRANHEVSSEFYRAKRPANDCWVTGYLVKNKNGEIKGILNKDNHFYELAWIIEDTLEEVR
jgi:hypothetical protein